MHKTLLSFLLSFLRLRVCRCGNSFSFLKNARRSSSLWTEWKGERKGERQRIEEEEPRWNGGKKQDGKLEEMWITGRREGK